MPSSHLNFLAHVNFRRFFLGCWISIILRNNFLTLVCSVGACVLSSLVHELDVNTAIGLVFDIYNMDVGIITTGDHHAWVWRYLKIKLIEYILRFINFAQFFLQVLCHIQEFAWLTLISNIPNLETKIVSGVYVIIISWWKFSSRYRINDICEKMLSWRVFFNHEFSRALIELRWYSKIA